MIKNFFHYTRFESALKIIETCSLISTHPKNLNDPFECSPKIKKRDEYTSDEWNALFNQHVSHNTKLHRDALLGYKLSGSTQPFESYFRNNYDPEKIKFQETMGKYFRIISGSEQFDIPPMWAHYGENHSGVVIEFDLGQEPFSGLLVDGKTLGIVRIEYSLERLVYCHLTVQLSPEKGVIQFARNKDERWRYEAEARIILPVGIENNPLLNNYYEVDSAKNLILKFPPQAIKTIYCGMRMTETNQNILKRLIKSRCNFPATRIKQVKPCTSKFNLIEV